jgi:RNA polymerase sigma factor (sigma-70 family)
MTGQETQQLPDLLEKAIRGNEQAISEVCEFVDKRRQAETMNRLSNAGVGPSLEEARQEVLLTVRQKLSQLRVVDAFESWLWRLEMSVAKKYRPRYARHPLSIQVEPKASEHPREIGTRAIVVAGKPQIVRIFERVPPQEQLSRRRPFFEPLTDGILLKASMSNRLNYPRKIDIWNAMSKLPPRWAEALRLRHVEDHTAAETAVILRCSVKRVYRLTQKGANRMRELLPSYDQNGLAILQARFPKAMRRTRTKRARPVSGLSLNARSTPYQDSSPRRIGSPMMPHGGR